MIGKFTLFYPDGQLAGNLEVTQIEVGIRLDFVIDGEPLTLSGIKNVVNLREHRSTFRQNKSPRLKGLGGNQ